MRVERLDLSTAVATGVAMRVALMVLVLIVEALIQWYVILSRATQPVLHESPYVATQWAPGFSGVAHGDD